MELTSVVSQKSALTLQDTQTLGWSQQSARSDHSAIQIQCKLSNDLSLQLLCEETASRRCLQTLPISPTHQLTSRGEEFS